MYTYMDSYSMLFMCAWIFYQKISLIYIVHDRLFYSHFHDFDGSRLYFSSMH